MSKKIGCGGFRIDDDTLKLKDDGTLYAAGGSIPKPLTYDYMPEGYPKKSEEVVTTEVDITWDGNTTGLVASSMNHMYRVSDAVYTLEQFKKMNYVSSGNDLSVASVIEEGGLNDVNVVNGIFTLWAGEAQPIIVTEEAVAKGVTINGGAPDTFSEPGVYFPADGSVTRLYSLEPIVETVTTIEKLNEEFLPYEAMKTNNPVGEGSFSMNRLPDSEIGRYSFCEGQNSRATGEASHAEGSNTNATGEASHAEGGNTYATGPKTHAEGWNTKALEIASHAEGYGTLANSNYAHAEGNGTTAHGIAAHAEGNGTSALNDAQHVQGRYNIDDGTGTYAHIVGNGTSVDNKSNAHTLDWSGNAWFAGTVEGTAMIVKSSTAGSSKRFKITVDDSGNISATEVTS